MASMEMKDLFKSLMMAALAFEQEYTEKQKAEQEDRALMSESELEDADDEEYPEDLEEGEFMERFQDFVENNGLENYQTAKVTADDAKRVQHILSRA